MSGHSHYATIKRQKGLKDASKGKIFSKLSRVISVAIRDGGGINPDSNYKLRMAIEQARAANMPKENIERILKTAEERASDVQEVLYEGFGPGGIAVMVYVITDNRNRTSQEIKNIFERIGGSLGGPGSVSFNFTHIGLILVKKNENLNDQLLSLIDVGAEDIEESVDAVEVYTPYDKMSENVEKIKSLGYEIVSQEPVYKPKNYISIGDETTAKKVLNFLNGIEEQDDVQKVFANIDIPDKILEAVESS